MGIKFLHWGSLAQVFVCHSRGSNRESIDFEKQWVLDSRLRGNDVRHRMLHTLARGSLIILFRYLFGNGSLQN